MTWAAAQRHADHEQGDDHHPELVGQPDHDQRDADPTPHSSTIKVR